MVATKLISTHEAYGWQPVLPTWKSAEQQMIWNAGYRLVLIQNSWYTLGFYHQMFSQTTWSTWWSSGLSTADVIYRLRSGDRYRCQHWALLVKKKIYIIKGLITGSLALDPDGPGYIADRERHPKWNRLSKPNSSSKTTAWGEADCGFMSVTFFLSLIKRSRYFFLYIVLTDRSQTLAETTDAVVFLGGTKRFKKRWVFPDYELFISSFSKTKWNAV